MKTLKRVLLTLLVLSVVTTLRGSPALTTPNLGSLATVTASDPRHTDWSVYCLHAPFESGFGLSTTTR